MTVAPIVLTVMPWGPSSKASAAPKFARPALEAH
jgi:hypothetical protein